MSDTSSDSLSANGPSGFNRRDLGLVDALVADLVASPTPYHAVERARSLLTDVGSTPIDLVAEFPTDPGCYVAAEGGTLLAWIQQRPGDQPHPGFTIVGAHTDSPNFRVRPHADVINAGLAQIGLETYGGLLVNSWLNRDLGLAGRIMLKGQARTGEILVNIDQAIMTIPQLAIHLDRDINDKGLDLNKQTHVNPMWTMAADSDNPPSFVEFLGGRAGVAAADILSWDLMPYDLQAPGRLGRDSEFIASGRIDNLLSSFCATRAMARLIENGVDNLHSIPVMVLYDHEEIGSESATGAASNLLLSVLERIACAQGFDRKGFLTMMARSMAVSADGAHATHPNYVDKHEPNHQITLNAGVVIKRNANQRYATDALSEAFMVEVCRRANVPVQHYIHRNDLPCGSTIGPITAARLGISTVDIGAPMLSM
ncbi:MAG: M18 family aminopeptidase, partial [Acidimicrobiia bacterium]|nr:M18 family aminopeptidase [Acidimicrobiia bacterium]